MITEEAIDLCGSGLSSVHLQDFTKIKGLNTESSSASLLFNVRQFDVRVRGSGGRLLPVRSQAGRVSSSSADHRVSSSPVRSGAAAERGILEGCPASRCPLGAGRG